MLWRAVAARVGAFGFALATGLASSIDLGVFGLTLAAGLSSTGHFGLRPLLLPLLSVSLPIPVSDNLGAECNWLVEVLHSRELLDVLEVLRDFDPGLAFPPIPLGVFGLTQGASSSFDDASVVPVEDVAVFFELFKELIPILQHGGILVQLFCSRNSSEWRFGGSFDLPGATRRRGGLR